MARLDIDGLELAYSDEGRGDPLQLVHGSASDQRTWEGQRGEFARHFRVVAFSRRYHWPNPPIPPDAQYTMREQLEDLKRVPRVLGIDSAHFVGHSYGAFLCLLLAIESPALVRTLVLAEPPVITLLTSNAPTPLELVKLALTRPRTLAAIVRFGLKGVAPARRAIADGRIEEGNRIFGDAVLGAGGFAGLSEARRQQVLDNGSNAAAELLGPGFEPLTAAPTPLKYAASRCLNCVRCASSNSSTVLAIVARTRTR